jgi:hypothetical protein
MNSVSGARLSLINLIDFIRLQFNKEALITLKFSVGWCLEYDAVSFWQEAVRNNNVQDDATSLLQTCFTEKKKIFSIE